MIPFHIEKPWQRRAKTQDFRICSVDPTDHRLRHSIKRFLSQTTPNKTCERFIVGSVQLLLRQEQVGRHAQFACETEDVTGYKRPEACRCEQLKTFRNRT